MRTSQEIHVPGFRILGRLGAGGSGTVYHAIQEGTERELALKVFEPADEPEATLPEHIEQERRIAANLRHRNLARIHAAGQYGERRWLACEYLPGGALDLRIGRGMTVASALDVVRDVARGLGHAHARGIVHGDVKPGNILFRSTSEAVLVDYGVAAFAGCRDGRAATHGGTPEYMSPEQARGEAIDGRSDFYSLGVVLHEMLTGRRLLAGEVLALPDRLVWLAPLLDALLAPAAEDRPVTATQVLALMASVCAASPQADGGQGDGGEVPRTHGVAKMAPASRAPLVVMGAALFLAFVAALWFWH